MTDRIVEWMDAGGLTSCAIVDGRIVAVLYWRAPQWRLVFADQPAAGALLDTPRMKTSDDGPAARRYATQIIRMRLGHPSVD